MGADPGTGVEGAQEGGTFCARHPNVETYLRCGRCNTPICPRCLVMSPVGARCPDCANVRRLPTIDVSPAFFARGMTAALVSGVAVGAFWAFVSNGIGFGLFFAVFIGLGIGWAISESVSLATNRKRGTALQLCAVCGVLLTFLVHQVLIGHTVIFIGDLIVAGVGAFFAASRLKF